MALCAGVSQACFCATSAATFSSLTGDRSNTLGRRAPRELAFAIAVDLAGRFTGFAAAFATSFAASSGPVGSDHAPGRGALFGGTANLSAHGLLS